MSTVIVLRHCYTKKGEGRGKGSHLSLDGVRQARRIGDILGLFEFVLTSTIPRTLETAIGMGFAVDEQLDALGEISIDVWNEIGHHERWKWEDPFGQFATIMASGGATATMGKQQHTIWKQAAQQVRENGRVLIISHGRVIESGLVFCFPQATFSTWGGPFQHGEGVELSYNAGQFLITRFYRNEQKVSPEETC